MNRRNFVAATAGAGVLPSSLPAAETKNALFELCYFRMRNGSQVQRTQEFLAKHFVPAAQRAGIAPVGFFSGVVAAESPSILCFLSYPSFAAMGAALDKMSADKEFAEAADAYNSAAELPYMRVENSLLRAFDGMPQAEVPRSESGRAPRIFELRTYESNTFKASKRKIKMFDDAEIAIFRRVGILPVFFGETLVGQNLPNLTYMIAFDDMAARDKAWSAFGRDPEWQKLRVQPGLTDPEVVSNISNSLWRPLPFSPIR